MRTTLFFTHLFQATTVPPGQRLKVKSPMGIIIPPIEFAFDFLMIMRPATALYTLRWSYNSKNKNKMRRFRE